MANHVYRLSEIVGSSPTSVDDAIRTAIRKASETVRNIEWFQTEEIRGQVEDGEIAHFQVRLKVGFEARAAERGPLPDVRFPGCHAEKRTGCFQPDGDGSAPFPTIGWARPTS